MMKKLLLLLGLTLTILAFACSEGETIDDDGICTAGAKKACPCTGSTQEGESYCNQDEMGWSECMGCPPIADVIDQPDVCTPKCEGKVCGDDGCEGNCGECKEGEECNEGKCECIPDCKGKNCGDDGCEGFCGNGNAATEGCEAGEVCNPATHTCGPPEGECYLNACMVNDHCKGCPNKLNQCWSQEHKCVECLPGHDEQCEGNLKCSLSGKCTQKTCQTGADGEPTIQCLKDSDCEACSPKHQVCDVETKKCVQCVGFADQRCLDSQYCLEGKCVPKCPQKCETDNDCMYCVFGATGGDGEEKPAHACNNHKCSECSATWACQEGLLCLPNGVCYPPCGLAGAIQGTCTTDQDCYYCGDPKNPGSYECKKPINDPDGHGTCFPPAEGCADLGAGVAVLPDPWNEYSELCSGDANCANVSIDYNVGKLIRELVGTDEVMGIEIGDATVKYGMNECAEIKVTSNIDCGICVPCKEDEHCEPIPVDSLIVDLFSGNALAQIAGLMLINMLWGDNEEHGLHLYCQPVGMGYGICAPCANPLQACGKTDPGGGSGTCDHDVCTEGTPLDPSCSACAKEVCAHDGYCCSEAWDNVCVGEVDQYCATKCGGPDPDACSPDICTDVNLPAQDPSCGDCVAAVCEADPFCCNAGGGAWDQYCVDATGEMAACEAQCGGGGGCAHDECETGGPLALGCSDCVDSVCGYDDWCCSNDWDSVCVEEAQDDENCDC